MAAAASEDRASSRRARSPAGSRRGADPGAAHDLLPAGPLSFLAEPARGLARCRRLQARPAPAGRRRRRPRALLPRSRRARRVPSRRASPCGPRQPRPCLKERGGPARRTLSAPPPLQAPARRTGWGASVPRGRSSAGRGPPAHLRSRRSGSSPRSRDRCRDRALPCSSARALERARRRGFSSATWRFGPLRLEGAQRTPGVACAVLYPRTPARPPRAAEPCASLL